MFKKILVPIDGSDSSNLAFSTALELAKLSNSEIILLNVTFTPQAYWGNNLAYSVSISEEELNQLGNKIINETIQNSDLSNITVTPKVLSGNAAITILKEALLEKVDLIIMGSHGQGPIVGAVLGSVSQKVLQKSRCPVMITKMVGNDFELTV